MAYLLQLVAKLQAQLAQLLEQKGLAIDGKTKRFDLPTQTFEAPGIKVVGGGNAAGTFIGDGNDIDDDSLQYQISLEITNTDLYKSLIIDRESIQIVPVDNAGIAVKPKHTFGIQTGIQLTATYAFDKNERKLIVIEPGQKSTVLLHHLFQFSAPGAYRGRLDSLKFTHDTVDYNAKENQFTQKGRTYTLDQEALQTLPIKFQSLLVTSAFKDVSTIDNQINLSRFTDDNTGISFDYPNEFMLERDGSETRFTYKGTPQIIFSTESEPKFKTVKLRGEKATMLQSERVQEKTQTFINDNLSGVAVTATPMTGQFYALTILSYADKKNNFTQYNFNDIITATFEGK